MSSDKRSLLEIKFHLRPELIHVEGSVLAIEVRILRRDGPIFAKFFGRHEVELVSEVQASAVRFKTVIDGSHRDVVRQHDLDVSVKIAQAVRRGGGEDV